jgi:hypothetical protein
MTGNAMGVTLGVHQDRSISASSGAVYQSYQSKYGDGWVPDLQFFYEAQPFHSEWLGSLGVFGQLGVSWKSALGSFQFSPINAGGAAVPITSSTRFTFVTLPLTAGGVYRFNLLRAVRPYVKAGLTLLGYVEDRSDNQGILRGASRGAFLGAGLAIPMDGLNTQGSWSLYEAHGVRRHSLTVDYQSIKTFSGALDFKLSGISVGLLFEL